MDEVRAVVGAGHVSTGQTDRWGYGRDLWPQAQIWQRQGRNPFPPDLVAWPGSVAEVQQLVAVCRKHRVPLVPYGAGSGVCGSAIPEHGGLVMDLKRLSAIRHLDPVSGLVEAEAGLIGQLLEDQLHAQGWTMGHYPSSINSSTLGGYLATRSAGQLSSRYGKIEDMVVALEAVLPDGQLWRSVPTPRSATGPDLKQLLIGSEGTLGVITAATMRIWPLPPVRQFQSYVFPSVGPGLEAMREIMQKGLRPAVVRLYDEADTSLALGSVGLEAEGCLLIWMLEGDDAGVELESNAVSDTCLRRGGISMGRKPGEHWYAHRHSMGYRQAQILPDPTGLVDTFEVATTWANLIPLYDAVRRALKQHAYTMAHFSHAYPEGCSIYFTALWEAENPESSEDAYRAAWDSALSACREAGGTISHHHGIGRQKAAWLKAELGPAYDMLTTIKQALDPDNIFNPGNLGLGPSRWMATGAGRDA
jgi:alkyldihydroxyacetonephosphate synthase